MIAKERVVDAVAVGVVAVGVVAVVALEQHVVDPTMWLALIPVSIHAPLVLM